MNRTIRQRNSYFLSGYTAARDRDLGIDTPEDISSRGVEAEESYWEGFVAYLDQFREFDAESRRQRIFASVFATVFLLAYVVIGIVKVLG